MWKEENKLIIQNSNVKAKKVVKEKELRSIDTYSAIELENGKECNTNPKHQ